MKRSIQPFTRGILAATLAATIAPALTAQERGWSKWNHGLQIGYVKPLGELAEEHKPGIGLAWFSEKVFSNGLAVRGRLEISGFGGHEKKGEYLGEECTYTDNLSQLGAMLDLVYYHGLRDTIYPFVGVGYFHREAFTEVIVDGTYYEGDSTPLKSEVAFCAGVGINLSRHWGVEAKYTLCEYNWAQFSLLLRF